MAFIKSNLCVYFLEYACDDCGHVFRDMTEYKNRREVPTPLILPCNNCGSFCVIWVVRKRQLTPLERLL